MEGWGGEGMKVLVACEESQAVCTAFRELGHEAYSCDILECSGGHPEWHIQGDVLPLINGSCEFTTMDGHTHTLDGEWDMLIAHPPCTYLTISGNAWFDVQKYGDKARQRYKDRYEAIVFFMHFALANVPRIAVENPIGIMNSCYRKADQIIQPYEYGHHARKATCLWLKGLPKLKPTNIVDPGEYQVASTGTGRRYNIGGSASAAKDENGKILAWNDPRTARIKSKTYSGIAKAMAEQWTKGVIT